MKFSKFVILIFCTLALLPYSLSMAYEEPNYEVVQKNRIYEVRKYSDRLAVETINSDSENNFRKLFNYISGRNEDSEKIKMTTPVTQFEKDGNMTMQFYLPSKFDLKNTPKPIKENVKIVNIEGGYYAVIRYSGRASDKNFIKHKDILLKELKINNILTLSPPIRATYDSPFTLPMNRRNEAMFKVEY
ncbi:heme-binding protein [Pelagibacterales bacterium SAG-MED03]|nr:heme-binding protein [Pelagibacterales bacterium SAG-MED03]